ncbi:MAG: tripartite tricarboxylate transporter permease [Aquamicrobium sp.]|nr:tripartite tricarboxylate transporter permease [Aquamicrobium sp.]
MTELLDHLAIGFSLALSLENLFYCFTGALIGTLIGVLPGIGPLATVALLLPITFTLEPVSSLIMLSGIYYGAQYGGSTTAILVNLPGEASAVVTTLDGHQMARQGRAGPALAIAALASFFAGTVATIMIATLALPLAGVALRFGPADYAGLMIFGLIGAVVLASGSLPKAIAMVFVGLLLGLIGIDINSGAMRYTFGLPPLTDGINFVALAVGLFGLGEIIRNLEGSGQPSVLSGKIGRLMPSWSEIKQSFPAAVRGTFVGSLLGVLPGGGATLGSFASYALEKKVARDPSRFGTGAIEGVAGPEAANNAGAQGSFIPMLTLGIPANAVMALIIGALTIQGIQPGPRVMQAEPELVWGLIASMWLGNLMLLVINLPLIGLWVRLLKVPYRLMFPAIIIFCAVGAFTINNSTFDIYMTALFGLLGYFFLKVGAEAAPLILGFVLGPLLEENVRRALIFSRGDPMTFLDNPICAVFLALSALLLLMMAVPHLRRGRREAFREE